MAGLRVREMRSLVKHLEAQGARSRPSSNGWVIYFPDGSSTTVHTSESDRNAIHLIRGRVRRAGLHFPGDPHPKKDPT